MIEHGEIGDPIKVQLGREDHGTEASEMMNGEVG